MPLQGNPYQLRAKTARGGPCDPDPHLLWEALMTLRAALMAGNFELSDEMERQRRMLVPHFTEFGRRGGAGVWERIDSTTKQTP